jgi:hypothetical protein
LAAKQEEVTDKNKVISKYNRRDDKKTMKWWS